MKKFFCFSQNNSGSSFSVNEAAGICEIVIIEASCAEVANNLAEGIGIYFDGVDFGSDCDCCGDRWYRVSEDDGTDEPMIYGQPILERKSSWFIKNVFIHYANGEIKKVTLKD